LALSGAGNKFFGNNTDHQRRTVNWSAGQVVVAGNGTITTTACSMYRAICPGARLIPATFYQHFVHHGVHQQRHRTLRRAPVRSQRRWAMRIHRVWLWLFQSRQQRWAVDIASGSIKLNMGATTLGAALAVTGTGVLNISGGTLNTGANNLTVSSLTLSAGQPDRHWAI